MLGYLNLHPWYGIGKLLVSFKIANNYTNIGLTFHLFTNVIPIWNLQFFPVMIIIIIVSTTFFLLMTFFHKSQIPSRNLRLPHESNK